MREEVFRCGIDQVIKDFIYVVDEAASIEICSNEHHEGWQLQDFVNLDEARKAGLKGEHVAALRLYTLESYRPINQSLRERCGRGKEHPLAFTIYLILKGLMLLRAGAVSDFDSDPEKRRAATKNCVLWTGLSLDYRSDTFQEYLRVGGTQLAFMSTSTDIQVATYYAFNNRKDTVLMRIITTNHLELGMDISWLSAFQGEKEYPYSPLAYLKPVAYKNLDELHFESLSLLVVELMVTPFA